ncbi:c-type cytochrome [Roseicella sp. DB1501]|uniref:c-type cytochrome n=1 Tax=Roseicella sp. DB1501 TaxID=2730925 RepID=UPI001492E9F0|nr:c-type cytochrome [Roseicella sp. DB1501]NOG69460.1 c-type cytochrome [Roseicella sp. DB1501]
MQLSRWLVAALLGLGLGWMIETAGAAAQAAGEAAPSPEMAVQGRRLYTRHCSHCHGIRMVNPGNSSFDLRKFPHDDKARFLASVTKGKNTMPAWGDMLTPEEIEQIWAYVLTGGRT